MQSFERKLNEMLIEVYHNILRVEEEFLRNNHRLNLTIREMHLIECVGADKEKGKTVSEIAAYLKVAKPSVTVAVNKLEKKGYLQKSSCETDGRVVRVTLTREGRKVYLYHERYHANMVHELKMEFSDEERDVLMRAIDRLNRFFDKGAGAEK
jgi:DNA-binding MarR family transcriptional regulator